MVIVKVIVMVIVKVMKKIMKWLYFIMFSATSKSSEISMLIGTHTIDFEQMGDDCSKTLETKIKQIKFTTCKDGEFTCNDGLCIDMEQRCDQVSNCLDESDENDCVTVVVLLMWM